MIIAIVDFHVAAKDRPSALQILAVDGAAAAALPGNLGFRVFSDAGSDTHVGLMQEWEADAAFKAYLASPGFATAGAALRPMMIGTPLSRRFEAKLYEEVR
jgi:quinol monooxygenase YgiN